MASETKEPTLVGELVTFSPSNFVYLCNNKSLGVGQPNHMKNPNAFDRTIACSFADSVVACGAMSETTLMVLSPASTEWATTETWLSGTMVALGHLPGTSRERAEMEGRIRALQAKGAKPTWEETIEATLWDYNTFGPPTSTEFNDARPEFVAVQGQHRAAVLNAVFATDLGLSLSRGGDLQGGLFTDDDRSAKMPILKEQLEKVKMSVNVYDFLTHDDAEEVGRRQRTVERTTTDVSFLDVATSLGVLVKQIFNPRAEICGGRAKEVFGDEWQKIMTKKSRKKQQAVIRKSLMNRVNNTIQKQLGLNPQGKNYFAVCVYAFALHPERPSLQILRQYFHDQNAQVVKAKAAKIKSVGRAGKHSAGEGSGDADNASATDYTPHRTTVTSMGAFFSLTPYSQNTQLVKDLVRERGLCDEFRTVCFHHFVVLEVVRAMVTGLATRRNCSDDPHPYTNRGTVIPIPPETSDLYLMLKTFVRVEEGAAVASEGEDFISGMHHEVDFWIPHLVSFALELRNQGPLLTGTFKLTKKPLKKSLNRRVNVFKSGDQQGPNPSNSSNLTPGWGVKLHMSTSGTEPDYTKRTWDDWFTDDIRGDDGEFTTNYMHRMVATVFGLLIVDRSLVGLSSRHKLTDRRGKFRELLGAIPAVGAGAGLRALLKNQEAVKGKLQVKDQSFFGEDRLALLFGGDEAQAGGREKSSSERGPSDDGSSSDSSSGVGEPDRKHDRVGEPARKHGSKGHQEKFAVSIIRDAGDHDADEVSVRWPKSVVEQLSLLDDDGELKCSDGVFRFNITKEATRDTANKRKKSTAAGIRMRKGTKRQKTTAQPREERGETTKRPASPTLTTKEQTKNAKGKEKASDGLEEREEGEEDKSHQSSDDSYDDALGQGEEVKGNDQREEQDDADSDFLLLDGEPGNGRLAEADGDKARETTEAEENQTNFRSDTFPPSDSSSGKVPPVLTPSAPPTGTPSAKPLAKEDQTNFHPDTFPSPVKAPPVPTPSAPPTGTPSVKPPATPIAEPSAEICEGRQDDNDRVTRMNEAVKKDKISPTQNVGGFSEFFKPTLQEEQEEEDHEYVESAAAEQEQEEEEEAEVQKEEQEQERGGPRRKGKSKIQQVELEYSTTEKLAINNAIMAVGDAIDSPIFSCESSTRYKEWYTRVAVRVQEELRKNQPYMEEYGMSLDTRFGGGQMRHLLLWFQDQKEMEGKARKKPTGASNEKSSDVSAADVEIRIKHEGFQPSDGGTALACVVDGVGVNDEQGGSGLEEANPNLYDAGKDPEVIVIEGAGSEAGRSKNEGNKTMPPSDREGRNDGGGGSKAVGVEKKRINAASSGQGSTGAEGEGSKTKRQNAGTENARAKRRRSPSIDEAIGTRVESRGGEALSGAAPGSSGSVGHASRVKHLRDLYHDAQSARSGGHATDDNVKAIFKQYCDYVLGNGA